MMKNKNEEYWKKKRIYRRGVKGNRNEYISEVKGRRRKCQITG